jgi:hypothetical protein
LSLEELWLQENTHKKSKNGVIYEQGHATSADEEWLPRAIHVSMPCHWSKGDKIQWIRWRHMDCMRTKGPTREANWLKKLYTSAIHPRVNVSQLEEDVENSRAHSSSAEPTLGRLIPAFHVVAPYWSKAQFSRFFHGFEEYLGPLSGFLWFNVTRLSN